jgi:hypothetical protein
MNDVPLRHQMKVARDTLKMTDEGVSILGGMTKDEARRLLQKHTKTRTRKATRP